MIPQLAYAMTEENDADSGVRGGRSPVWPVRRRGTCQKHRGEISGGHPDTVTVGELLDDVLEYAKTNIRPSTEYIWRLVIAKNLRPFFATLKSQKVTTEKLKQYRRKRIAEGRSGATANRELPFFPMTPETNVRTGFLSDEQYAALLNELPVELQPLFATACETGIRKGPAGAHAHLCPQ